MCLPIMNVISFILLILVLAFSTVHASNNDFGSLFNSLNADPFSMVEVRDNGTFSSTPSTSTTNRFQRFSPSSTSRSTRATMTTSTSTTPTSTTTITTTTAPNTLASVVEPANANFPEVYSFCNDPGRPPKSRISPVQLTYTEDDQVVYTCDNFISLKQYRKCVHGRWIGDTPMCGDAFRVNDLAYVRIYELRNHFRTRLLSEYNVTGQLAPFAKFGNSFIAERLSYPVRAQNATNYHWQLYLQRPAMIQMVRISFSVVNHLVDVTLMNNHFDIVRLSTNRFRNCVRVANNSVSPWHFNSTRFDFWYFCRSKSEQNFQLELTQMSDVVLVETSSQVPITFDLATFILAEQYVNNNNRSDPICGLPEIPLGLEARVVNDQSNYVFTCAKHFKRVDTFGGQFHLRYCGYDARWHGPAPQCYPTKTCKVFNFDKGNFLVEVYKYDRVYYVNDTEWVPVHGSRAFFRCKDETNIFVGKEVRVCDEDGEWTNSLPNCLVTNKSQPDSLRTTSILIIVLTTLIFTFVLSSCTIYCFLKLRSTNAIAGVGPQTGGLEMNESAYYATGGHDGLAKDIDDDVYESVDPSEARYASYQDSAGIKANSSNPFVYDYSDASSYPTFVGARPLVNTDSDPYYDDTNVRPDLIYRDSYAVMRKPFI